MLYNENNKVTKGEKTMSSKKKYNLIAKTGEYELNGEKKARWFTCGGVFENENGQLSVKIDGIPVGTDWNGWLTLSTLNEQKSGAQTPAASSSAKTSAPEVKNGEQKEEEKDTDNLPF